MVNDVQRQARGHDGRATLSQEQPVEGLVERDDQNQQPRGQRQSLASERHHERKRCDRRCPVSPAQIQSGRARAATQEQRDPRDAPSREVGIDHPNQRPSLQMLALEERIENDAAALVDDSHAQVDVFDRRLREASLVKSAAHQERISTDCTQPGPEGGRRTCRRLVYVVMQQIAEVGNDAAGARIVVVRAEQRGQSGIARKGRLDSRERVRMYRYVGVDEDDDVTARAAGPRVPRRGGPYFAWSVHHDQLRGRVDGGFDRAEALVERCGSIRGRHDDRKRKHLPHSKKLRASGQLR